VPVPNFADSPQGETVVDLGSGAGLDVFLSASRVGAKGRAIGIDRNKDMLAKANENKRKGGIENAEFVESPITRIELPDGIADCVISNCVINLVPEDEKHLVFKEIFRLSKPGGRVAISDILAKKPLPEALRMDVARYVGCIAGASLVEHYRAWLQDAGFHGELTEFLGGSICSYVLQPLILSTLVVT
jgi:ubiquinone/menaquinone biosynthesis C-methylase UbiE